MGNNVDLCQMLDVPFEVECPRCGSAIKSDFDDYDIECGHPNPEPGVWSLRVYCPKCEHDWQWEGFCQTFERGTRRVLKEEIKKDIERAVRVSAGGGVPLEGFVILALDRIYGYLEMDPNVTREWFK